MPFVKLDADIVTSTVWQADDYTFRVWVLFLAKCDKEGFFGWSVPAIASHCRGTLEQTEASIALLESPDPYSRTPDLEGRRILRVEGGWQIANYSKYRNRQHHEDRKERNREAQRRFREQHKPAHKTGKKAETESAHDLFAPAMETPDRPETVELRWRVRECWNAFLAQRKAFFEDVNGIAPSNDPALTKDIAEAIRRSILEHDKDLLAPDQREAWTKHSRARAAGIGIFLDPFLTGTDKDNDVRNGGKRYLEAWRPWKQQRGKGDPVSRFADLYFEARDVRA